jgi:hypothetical protein
MEGVLMNTDKFLVAALALGANEQQATIPDIRRAYHEHELNINRTYNALKELLRAQRGPAPLTSWTGLQESQILRIDAFAWKSYFQKA